MLKRSLFRLILSSTAVSSVLLFLFVLPVSADVKYWQNSTGGSFQSGSNWSTGTAPVSGDFALFNLTNNGTISYSASAAVNNVAVGSLTNPAGSISNAAFDLNGNQLTTTWLSLGSGGAGATSGELTIQDGTVAVTAATILEGNSRLIVTNGGQLTTSWKLDVGNDATTNQNVLVSVQGPNTTASFGQINAGGSLTATSFSVGGGALLTVGGTMNLGSTSSLNLSNGVIDAAGINVTAGAQLTGHGVVIGNSSGLSVTSPNGAVDTSYDMNIGSRRADIFSNSAAKLRGDVGLSNGGQLNSGESLILQGNTFTQSGGTTRVLDRIRFIDGINGTVSGGTMHASSHIQIGEKNSAGTLRQTGGTIVTEKFLIVGSEGSGIYEMSGGTLNVNTPGDTRVLLVGDGMSSNGSVIQTGGIINAHEVRLSNHATANASYSMQSGTLSTSHQLRVGYNATGSMNQTGGTVGIGTEIVVGQHSGANGTYTISGGTLNTGTASGAADPDLEVGFEGTGTFNQSGGTVTIADELVIGHRSTGNGTVNLSGGVMNVNDPNGGSVEVGNFGNGALLISGSAELNTAGGVSLGAASSGVGTLTQSGGTVNIATTLDVGFNGQGTFNISDGSMMTTDFVVGSRATSNGSVTQTGGSVMATNTAISGEVGSVGHYSLQGGTLTTDALTFGDGTGTFELTGGTLTTDLLQFGDGAGPVTSSGSFTLDGGTLDVGTLNAIDGTFSFASGTLNADDVTLATLTMNSGLLDVRTLNGDLNMSGGVLAPGDSPGTTTINGDYLLSGGTLEMELAGLTQGTQYDFIDINGDWTITGGSLQLLLLSGFMPGSGDSFDLFDFNSVTGMFDSIALPTLTAGLSWDTSNLYTTGTIGVSGTAAVPEPSSFAITGLGLGFIAWRRKRRMLAESRSGEPGLSDTTM